MRFWMKTWNRFIHNNWRRHFQYLAYLCEAEPKYGRKMYITFLETVTTSIDGNLIEYKNLFTYFWIRANGYLLLVSILSMRFTSKNGTYDDEWYARYKRVLRTLILYRYSRQLKKACC